MIGETNGQAGALYLTLRNGSDAADVLRSAACGCAEETSLHVTETSGGRSAMQHLDELDIPAGSTVTMSPGGTHIMLERLTRPLVAGEKIEVVLELGSGSQTLEADVVPLSELNELVGA